MSCICTTQDLLRQGCLSTWGGPCKTASVLAIAWDSICQKAKLGPAPKSGYIKWITADDTGKISRTWVNTNAKIQITEADVRDLVNCYYCSGCSKYRPCIWDEDDLPVCEDCERIKK